MDPKEIEQNQNLEANMGLLQMTARSELRLVLDQALERTGRTGGLSSLLKLNASGVTRYIDPQTQAIAVALFDKKALPDSYSYQNSAAARQIAVVYTQDGAPAAKITRDHVVFRSGDYRSRMEQTVPVVTEIEDFFPARARDIYGGRRQLQREIKAHQKQITLGRDHARALKEIFGAGPQPENEGDSFAQKFKTAAVQGPLQRRQTFKIPAVIQWKRQAAADFALPGRLISDRRNRTDGSYTVIQHNGKTRTMTAYNRNSRPLSNTTYDAHGGVVKETARSGASDIPINRSHGWLDPHGKRDMLATRQVVREMGMDMWP